MIGGKCLLFAEQGSLKWFFVTKKMILCVCVWTFNGQLKLMVNNVPFKYLNKVKLMGAEIKH